MKKLTLLLFLIIFASALYADHHKGDRGEKRVKIWEAKLKVDLLELKGPPSVDEMQRRRLDKLSDLDLLINSGKYDGGELERLKNMRSELMDSELPSQELINTRHERRIELARSKIQNWNRMNNNHNHDARHRDKRDRNQWERRRNRHKR